MNDRFLLQNKMCKCVNCNKDFNLARLDSLNFARFVKNNYDYMKDEKNLDLLADAKGRFAKKYEKLKVEFHEDTNFLTFIQKDYKNALRILEHFYTIGNKTTLTAFYKLETGNRDQVIDMILEQADAYGIYCKTCATTNYDKTEVKEEKVPKQLTLERIYEVTENRIEPKAIQKMAQKIQVALQHNELNNLVVDKVSNNPLKIDFANNKPYHMVVQYQNLLINITPYYVWVVDAKAQEHKVIYNNIQHRFKGSIQQIQEIGKQFAFTNAFEVAYLLYNGRKNVNILLEKDKW